MDTNYPFEDQVRVTLQSTTATTLHVRIPCWAHNAVVTVNGVAGSAAECTMHKVACAAGTTKVVVDLSPEIRLESWDGVSVSVHRGPLLFAVPIQGRYNVTHQYAFQSQDIDVTPVGNWSYALDIDPAAPAADLKFVKVGYQPGAAPFNHTNWSVYIEAPVRLLHNWPLEKNSAGMPPASPAW